MATINASSSADIIVPSVDGSTYRGLGGDDTYIVSNAASGSITIVDTSGANKIQLVDGLSIASSKFAADSVQLTLSNGAVITVILVIPDKLREGFLRRRSLSKS